MFVLHGNVYDTVLHQQRTWSLAEFLTDALLKESRETIAVFNVATGVRFAKRADELTSLDELLVSTQKERVLAALERLLISSDKVAIILEYAEAIAPAGDPSFQADADRAAIVTLHRWSLLPEIERRDNIVLVVAENLLELAPKIVSNPKVAVVEVPMPDKEARKLAARVADSRLSERDAERYSEITAGLKAVQIASILAPPPPAEEEASEREQFIARILGGGADAAARAHKLARLTNGMNQEEIKKLLAPELSTAAAEEEKSETTTERARKEADRLIARRKREILERECFGLVEFVEPKHGFEVVGGMDEVKKDLLVIAESIREGRTSRVPMGILFTGPMGTGKTFVAEAFAKECGLTTIKLKNFRSKWVGATEGNLEKILGVIRAIGQVIVIIDEGDRAFGNTDGEGDGGTSSRVIARIKEFMSDTSNRGRILFLVMTNRPDKLDVDLKRAGRLDRKIPFLYSQTPEEVETVARAQVRKNRINTDVDFATIREGFSAKLVGYSNADVEAVILMANDDAAREASADNDDTTTRDAGTDAKVTTEHLLRAAADYFPSRDTELLEYMELLAVFEASSRRLLPPKYAALTSEELDMRLRELRLLIGARR
jgi:AAA+ superfamily predicted ATPase